MHHRMFSRSRSFLNLTACAACLGLAGSAAAVERFPAIPLPDAGQGSTAKAGTPTGPFQYAVVGSQQEDVDSYGPVVWRIAVDPSDPSGNTVYATSLPRAPESDAEATDVTPVPGHAERLLIVGNVDLGGGDGGGWRPILWRQGDANQFEALPLESGTEGQARAISVRPGPAGLIIVVCGRFRLANGDWHACLWRVGPAGAQRTDLGTLGGRFSEARDGAYVEDLGAWSFVGTSEASDGRQRATLWGVRLTGEGEIDHVIRALPTPRGEESSAEAILERNGTRMVQGNKIGTDGTTLACLWRIQDGSASQSLSLGAPEGYRNSTALGLIVYGQNGDDMIAVGSAWNSETDRTGMGTLFGSDFGEFDSYRFEAMRRTETVDNNETITIHGNRTESAGALVGDLSSPGSAYQRAALFVPAPREVPNIIAILIGLQAGPAGRGPEVRPSSLWQRDGTGLLARRAKKPNRVVVELGSDSLAASAPDRRVSALELSGRITPRKSDGSLTWSVETQVYDNVSGVWVTLGFFEVAEGPFVRTLGVPDSDPLLVASGERLRTRLVVSQLTGKAGDDWFFLLDHMEHVVQWEY